MASQDRKVIPIEHGHIIELHRLMKLLDDEMPRRTEPFNAIFVDRSDMTKMLRLPWPPPPFWRLPVYPKIQYTLDKQEFTHNEARTFIYEKTIDDDHVLYREEW